MARYAKPPDLAAIIRKMQLDIKVLQQKAANVGLQPAGTSGAVYDSNVVWNGSMESGVTSWAASPFPVGPGGGVLSADGSNPIEGIWSLRMDENNTVTAPVWLPSGNGTSPTPGFDVFATAPGDVWKVTAKIRSSVATPNATVGVSSASTPTNVYQVGLATNTVASALPLTANVVTTLTGDVTIPAGGNYIAVWFSPNVGAGAPVGKWFWQADGVKLQRKLS